MFRAWMKYNTKYQATGEGVSLAVKLTLIQVRLARSKVEKIPRPHQDNVSG